MGSSALALMVHLVSFAKLIPTIVMKVLVTMEEPVLIKLVDLSVAVDQVMLAKGVKVM